VTFKEVEILLREFDKTDEAKRQDEMKEWEQEEYI